MRGVFLGISKAFNKVWHDGLIFKLKFYGVEGELLSLLKNYLQSRKQRVVLNGKTSGWRKINSGAPQGLLLGPLLFLIYINHLPNGITSMCKTFSDDTSLFSKVIDLDKSVTELNTDLQKISQWTNQWKMQFNPDSKKQTNEDISSCKLVSNNLSRLPVKFNNSNITRCSHGKHLGVVLDSNLNFNTHIDQKN